MCPLTGKRVCKERLLLPAALASTTSEYQVAVVSNHLTTNASIIELFGLAKVTVNEQENRVVVEPLGRY
uniref:Uncharacterized protein n=1 Tax=Tolypothrix bouteillei VB521301 TaxID=1479485 RepID=A0A0C1RJ84_9CYAN